MAASNTTEPILIAPGDQFQVYTKKILEVPLPFSVFVVTYVVLAFVLIVPVSKFMSYYRLRKQKLDGSMIPPQEGSAETGIQHSVEMVQLESHNHSSSLQSTAPQTQLPSGGATVSTGPTLDESVTAASLENNYNHENSSNVAQGRRTSPGAKQFAPPTSSQVARIAPPTTNNAGARSTSTQEMSNQGVLGNASSEGTSNNAHASSFRQEVLNIGGGGNGAQIVPDFPHGFVRGSHPQRASAEQLSQAPSAATTGMLRSSAPFSTLHRRSSVTRRQQLLQQRPFQRTVGWAHQPSNQRTQAIRGYVQAERRSAVAASEDESTTSRGRDPTWMSRSASRTGGTATGRPNTSLNRARNSSDAVNMALQDELVEGEADFYRQRYVERSRRRRRSSSATNSDRSFMGALSPDALSPEDAADADDPGRPNPYQNYEIAPPAEGGFLDPTTGVFAKCGGLLDLVELDYDARRIMWLTIPSKLSAVTEPFLKLVLIAIISHYIDTQSMVAYVLVIGFVELTNSEISGSVTDAEMSMIQMALSHGGEAAPFLIGQYMQLALLMQILILTPLLLLWVFFVDDFVNWILSHTAKRVATLAFKYTQVIIVDYILQSATKTFMFPFHMDGRKTFEPVIDLVAKIITLIVIVVLAITEENSEEKPTIQAIAVVQVVASCTKTIVKVAYVVLRGWFAPYSRGYFASLTLLDCYSVTMFLGTAFPLLLGSLLELREWQILTLFVHELGPGEVATWSLMHVVWEVFEALTAGLGEAGAVRISYYLTENLPAEAKRVSHKVLFYSIVQGIVFGSIVLMLGPFLAVALTVNPTIQNQFVDLVGITALASFAMTFALVTWSLLGAQGRFGIATACVVMCRWFIIYPIAAICVWKYHYEAVAVAGSIAVGYATASFLLGLLIVPSDWDQYALVAQDYINGEVVHPVSTEAAAGEEESSFGDSSDSSAIL